MKKAIIFVINPLLIVCVALISLPGLKDYVEKEHKEFLLPLGIFVVVGNVFVYIFNIALQYGRDAKRLADYDKLQPMDETAELFFQKYAQYDLSLNIMRPSYRFFYKIEPKVDRGDELKFTWVGKIFDLVWFYNEKIDDFKFTTKQGFCGKAYNSKDVGGSLIIGPAADDTRVQLNFSKKQLEHISDIVFVASCAIKSKSNPRRTIAVLNIESSNQNSMDILTNVHSKDSMKVFSKEVKGLAKIYSGLLS